MEVRAPSDPSDANSRVQTLPFSLMERKTRGDCIIRLPPSRVLRFLPSAPGEIRDVPPSITNGFPFSRDACAQAVRPRAPRTRPREEDMRKQKQKMLSV